MNNATSDTLLDQGIESGTQSDRMKNMPTIRVGEEERAQNRLHEATQKAGFDLFFANGCLLIKNVFSPEYIQRLHNVYSTTYPVYAAGKDVPDALAVGGMRRMVTVELKGLFNSPEFYANPLLLPLMALLLEPMLILNTVTVVQSLPGAPAQHVHRDHPGLFPTSEQWKMQRFIPPHAITLIIPLVPLNEITGTTRMWRGSHHERMKPSEVYPYVDPYAELGDCLLMDYRLLHGGLPNRSPHVRPVIYNVYCRRWFRDEVNYAVQQPLVVSDEEYAKMPEQYRYLIRWLRKG
jgi:hypothetical protein